MKRPSACRRSLLFVTCALAMIAAPLAQAVPVPTIPSPVLLPGFKVEWVQVDAAPGSTADALAILNRTGGFTILDTHEDYLERIELADSNARFTGIDPVFAVRVSGFISLSTDGPYSFLSFHDDGLRVRVGGETVIDVPFDTPPVGTHSAFYELAAGVYEYEAISWEQGGTFRLFLGIDVDGPNNPWGGIYVQGSHAPVTVPEPGTLSLLGLASLALVSLRRKTA
jgi:PEP-CTERM motif